jgi:cell wall assembly regulator SMI1
VIRDTSRRGPGGTLTLAARVDRIIRHAETEISAEAVGDIRVVKPLLARLEYWLKTNRPDYLARLQPGVTDAQLDAFEAQFSLQPPTAFRDLYRWRNGQEEGCSASLQMNRMFSPLEAVADTKEMLNGMIGFDFDREDWWRRGWIPFLSNGGGSHLCLDVAAEDGGRVGQLVAFWKADEDRPIEYPSLEAWLEDLVSSMENGELELL